MADALPGLYLVWDESAEPLVSFLRYQVYKRLAGALTWTKVARITDRSLATYTDYRVRDDTVYEYVVTVVASIGGDEVESVFGTPVQGSVAIRAMFIHDSSAPEYYVELDAEAASEGQSPAVSFLQVWDRVSPTAHVGPARPRQFRASSHLDWTEKQSVEDAVRALLARQAAGSALVARWYGGEVLSCAITSFGEGYSAFQTTWDVALGETYYMEAVA